MMRSSHGDWLTWRLGKNAVISLGLELCLFQHLKILDLVFIVEHTYQGKVLHTQLQSILGEKKLLKKKSSTGLVMQSQLEEPTLAKELWPLTGPS